MGCAVWRMRYSGELSEHTSPERNLHFAGSPLNSRAVFGLCNRSWTPPTPLLRMPVTCRLLIRGFSERVRELHRCGARNCQSIRTRIPSDNTPGPVRGMCIKLARSARWRTCMSGLITNKQNQSPLYTLLFILQDEPLTSRRKSKP